MAGAIVALARARGVKAGALAELQARLERPA
jgi:hypothetical protein